MNELKEPGRRSEDEVDLRLVFKKIGNGLSRLNSNIARYLQLAIRNPLLVLTLTLLGLGVGYAYFKFQKPFYKSSMTLMLNKIRNEFVEDQLKRLSDMVDEGNHAAIASRLEITPEAASQIRSLKFSNLDQDRISDDSVLTGSPFRIELSLYNNELFSTMEPALTDFMETNPFFSKVRQIRENELRKLISKLRNDINSIDSVKTSVVAPKGPVSGFIYGEALDPTDLYRESISMYRQQVDLESNLDMVSNVEVINGFVPRIKPAGPKLDVILVISGLLGLIAGLLVAGKLEKRRRGL